MTEAKVPEDRLTPEEMEELYADAEARHERDGDLDTLSIVCAVEAWRHERAEVRRLRAALERIELASRYVPLEWRTSFVTTLGDIARNALNPADSAPAQEEA